MLFFSNLAFIHSQESPDRSFLVKEEKERREDSNQFQFRNTLEGEKKANSGIGNKTARLKKKYETPQFHFFLSLTSRLKFSFRNLFKENDQIEVPRWISKHRPLS